MNSELLHAVLVDPHDDAPRLVAADWLEEHAEEVECTAISRWGHSGDRCIGGRVQCPNPAFTENCTVCNGTGSVSNGYAERAERIPNRRQLLTDTDVS